MISAGLGLKPEFYEEALAWSATGAWFEIHPENYMVDGGPRLRWLEAIRARHPVSLHGVALSLAADAEPDEGHLARLANLAARIEPVLVSEHLAWSTWRGTYFPDLLPFPRSTTALKRIARNIDRTQEALGRRIAVENPSYYLVIDGHEWAETEFLAEIARRTGCGLLLDVNNVAVSANNLGFRAEDYIDRFPAGPVMEIHVAGHSPDPAMGRALLVDTHDSSVSADVWALLARALGRTGPRPVLVERDANLPDFCELEREAGIAARILDSSREAGTPTGAKQPCPA